MKKYIQLYLSVIIFVLAISGVHAQTCLSQAGSITSTSASTFTAGTINSMTINVAYTTPPLASDFYFMATVDATGIVRDFQISSSLVIIGNDLTAGEYEIYGSAFNTLGPINTVYPNGPSDIIGEPFADFVFNIEKQGGAPDGDGTVCGDVTTTFVPFTLNAALPVELTSLNATPSSKFISLNWETATEDNNEGFTVQRSMNGTGFTDLGFVTGAGTSTEVNNYTYQDTDVRPGNDYFYRLAQRDLDGTITNSPIVTARIEGSGTVSVFPNPATTELFISRGASQEGQLSYEIFSTLGKRVAAGQTTDFTARVDIAAMPTGSYFVRTSVAGQSTETKRIVVRR